MKYPKKIMSVTEMCSLGFSRYYLNCCTHSKYRDKFVTRTSHNRNGRQMIDTDEFEKLRKKGVFG